MSFLTAVGRRVNRSPAVFMAVSGRFRLQCCEFSAPAQWDLVADDWTGCWFQLTFYPHSCTEALPGSTLEQMSERNDEKQTFFRNSSVKNRHTVTSQAFSTVHLLFFAVIKNPVSKVIFQIIHPYKEMNECFSPQSKTSTVKKTKHMFLPLP